ncbi:unnamed protein product, partial [Sphacelaria rigidula]
MVTLPPSTLPTIPFPSGVDPDALALPSGDEGEFSPACTGRVSPSGGQRSELAGKRAAWTLRMDESEPDSLLAARAARASTRLGDTARRGAAAGRWDSVAGRFPPPVPRVPVAPDMTHALKQTAGIPQAAAQQSYRR